MPLLPNLADIKGFASSFNPLNAFSSPEPTTTTPTPASPSTPTPASHTASAVAGPGPSTLSIGTRSSSLAPVLPASSHLGPTRPSISMDNSSADSLDGLPGRRKSATSVVISSPEVIGRGERSLAGPSRVGKNVKADGTAASASSGAGTAERRRRRVPLDTYIIVKPPPTSSKHPLNLQIQLVVKSGGTRRERSQSAMSFRSSTASTPSASPTHSPVDLPNSAPGGGGAVVDLSSSNSDDTRSDSPNEEDGGASGLQRAVSLKSSVSQRSASVSTLASNDTAGSFGGGTRKRVEPMFNLAVHNVMHPTTVTDAATDFKVAKFLKRSLDVSGVGLLEPAEVWLPSPNAPANLFPLPSNSDDGHVPPPGGRARPMSMVSLTSPITPIVTRSDDGRTGLRTSLDLKNFRVDGLLGSKEDGGAKKFFGKMFKKKHTNSPAMPQVVRKSPSPSFSNDSADTLPSAKAMPTPSDPHGHAHSTHGHPTFGTAPLIVHRRSSGTIVSPDGAVTGLTAPPTGLAPPPSAEPITPSADGMTTLPMIPSSRPVGYTWTVRRWAKKNTDGWAAHLVAAAAAGLELVNGAFSPEAEDEVVFEWVKLKPQAVGPSIMRRYSVTGTIASTASRDARTRSKSPYASHTSLSLAAPPTRRTASPFPPASPSIDGGGGGGGRPASSPRKTSDTDTASIAHTEEEEDDSDPEDSETPWACSIWVKKTGQRLLLGTLTPAPHHPKVIGVLKIPMGLDPVALAQLNAIGAGGGGDGSGMANKTKTSELEEIEKRVKEEVALTEENLKDVVCVTAMWLVAREEFGGLGRRRKH